MSLLVDKQATRCKRLAIDFQQVEFLYFVFEHAQSGSWSQALGLFKERAHHYDVRDFGRTQFVGHLRSWNRHHLHFGSRKISRNALAVIENEDRKSTRLNS